MKNIFFCFLLLAVFASCRHGFKEYDKKSFPDYHWKKDQAIMFRPKIGDINKTYRFTVGIRHVHGMPIENLPITVRMISPSGNGTKADYNIVVRKSPGEYVGRCAGDICDLETVVDDNLHFTETGDYQILITHNSPTTVIPGVMEVGVMLDANEK